MKQYNMTGGGRAAEQSGAVSLLLDTVRTASASDKSRRVIAGLVESLDLYFYKADQQMRGAFKANNFHSLLHISLEADAFLQSWQGSSSDELAVANITCMHACKFRFFNQTKHQLSTHRI